MATRNPPLALAIVFAGLSVLAAPPAWPQEIQRTPPPGRYDQLAEAGPHHRRVEHLIHQEGSVRTNSYVELRTGLNVWSERENQWVPASDEIEIVGDGAIARGAAHQVAFEPDLMAEDGHVAIAMPGKAWMRTKLWGLAYHEAATGRSVFIADPQSSGGELAGRNQVIYPDAFNGVRAPHRTLRTLRTLRGHLSQGSRDAKNQAIPGAHVLITK